MSPAVTSVSLLANAMFIPFFIASMVGFKPTFPETATTRISTSLFEASSIRPSSPYKNFMFL